MPVNKEGIEGLKIVPWEGGRVVGARALGKAADSPSWGALGGTPRGTG